jgi:hypothetical protein
MPIWPAFVAAALISTAVHAQDIALFNGKDLSGWAGDVAVRGSDKPKIENFWSVEHGLLHCDGGANHWSWLHTDKDYSSFRLHLEWRWREPAPEVKKSARNLYNSGVFLRAEPWDSPPTMPIPATFEAQILPSSEATGDIWVIGENNPNFSAERLAEGQTRAKRFLRSKFAEKPIGEWNTYDITLDGDKLIFKVNGQQVNEGHGAAVIPGKIGLECENTPIDFRNIRLRPIGK